MLILTQPNISKFNPIKQSSTVNCWGIDYCMAQVEDNFCLSTEQLDKNEIDFWYEIDGGWFAWEDFDEVYKMYRKKAPGGLIQMVTEAFNISQPWNVANAIGTMYKQYYEKPFEFWEKTIKKAKKQK